MSVNPQQLEKALFLGRGVDRFTQDSPILPDVWMEYGERPNDQIDLLLNPFNYEPPGKLCDVLNPRLEDPQRKPTPLRLRHYNDPELSKRGREMAFNQSTVALHLYFDELICIVLPMTRWWNKYVWTDKGKDELKDFLNNKKSRERLAAFLKKFPLEERGKGGDSRQDSTVRIERQFSTHLVWMIRVIGAIALAGKRELSGNGEQEEVGGLSIDKNIDEIVEAAADLLRDYRLVENRDFQSVRLEPTGPRSSIQPELDADTRSLIWSINCNRISKSMIYVSTAAVKADAARLLFDISCKNLCWAIIDSGVDARHPALQRRPPEEPPVREVIRRVKEKEEGEDKTPHQQQATSWTETTRVIATYDFTIIRRLLNYEQTWEQQLPWGLQNYFGRNPDKKEEFKKKLHEGRSIDWDYLLPFLAIPYIDKPPTSEDEDDDDADSSTGEEGDELRADEERRDDPAEASREGEGEERPTPYYIPPRHHHGTHVAGILAADWRKDDEDNELGIEIKGVCPDIRLYDLRVLGPDGTGDEFTLIAAMQFVRHLNAHKEKRVIHGVNLSICIKHNVRNYACGCTPVCEESERMVNSGVVVVAAAGNEGYLHYLTRGGKDYEGYSSISISDPGNTEAVITVGSTHRDRAHTYGVSFFSSRGPTGDGRLKPDLVAPGEKIVSLIPDGQVDIMDGTSMAAPHVSGAAALLMARYEELIGRPTRVKQILCSTATDLGRERYFQGYGMVDILRAMQSI